MVSCHQTVSPGFGKEILARLALCDAMINALIAAAPQPVTFLQVMSIEKFFVIPFLTGPENQLVMMLFSLKKKALNVKCLCS